MDPHAGHGGNVWDLCSYNGKLYLILAYDSGWVLFRGEKGGAHPNSFGWTWTEIVGDNGSYPPAMDKSVGEKNAAFAKEYGCSEYGARLNSAGLLESTATPFVYKGKMYIGTFDNATNIQSQTVTKFLMKLKYASNSESKLKGPTLKQIYAPFYEVLSHPQRIWVMDENERITAADSANALLKGTTNDYVWRFVEHKGRLYTGTFDSSTAYNYFLGTHIDDFLEEICAVDTGIPQSSRELFSGKILKRVRTLAANFISKRKKNANNSLQSKADDLMEAAENTSQILEKFYAGDCTVDEVLVAIKALKESRSAITDDQVAAMDNKDFSSLVEKVDTILNFFDVEGLVYWAKARALVRKEAKGFDLLTTTDGEHWDRILDDGIKDRYNYGGRTFTVCNNELYVGTANPYYGAQLWKITDLSAPDDKVASKPRLSKKSVKVKKGKTVKVKIIGKTPGTTITYKNTKYAKITSKRTASVLKVKGLKKGKTTLKIKVNGVTLKLKVTVK